MNLNGVTLHIFLCFLLILLLITYLLILFNVLFVRLFHIILCCYSLHCSTLAWKIPRMEEPGGLQSMGSQRVGHDWATSLSLFTFLHWRKKWQPTPVFLPGEFQGRKSLGGLPSMRSHSVRHDWSDLAAAVAAIVYVFSLNYDILLWNISQFICLY